MFLCARSGEKSDHPSGQASCMFGGAERDDAELGALLRDHTEVQLGREVLRLRDLLHRVEMLFFRGPDVAHPLVTEAWNIAKEARNP